MKTAFLILIFAVSLFSVQAQQSEKSSKTPRLKVLVFSKTAGYRHKSIADGLKMFSELAQQENWTLTATEDAGLFTSDFLKNFDVVVFLSPTHDVLNAQEQAAFKQFMESGKGFVGIHSASDCEYDWPWYGKLVGAYFKTHPPVQQATIVIEDTNHPAMVPFKDMKTFTTTDEWYCFTSNPRAHVHVLAHLDESSIKKTNKENNWQMGDHPLIWYQEINGMRSFYTALGHVAEDYQNPKFQAHIAGAVNWAGHVVD